MELLLSNTSGKEKIEVSAITFGQEFNEPLIHQVVTAYLSGGRSGTKAQKSRGQVRGGGSKPWRQKGTGHARAGTITSPIWRTGGRTFAAVPRDFEQKVNKKMYRGAMRSILSELARQGRLLIVNEITVHEPKTKLLIAELTRLEATNALVVVSSWDANLYLAARNIPKVDIKLAEKLDPASLVRFEKIIMTVDAVRKIEGALA